MSKDAIEAEGTVIEAMPNAFFRVKLDNNQEIIGHLSGKMRLHYIKVITGDRVKIELSPYDLTKGRIVHRLQVQKG
ncbi:MAG TPA: translation initiation factor IF-1 [Patescibacteria group bacterium]|nr:translation initiation factor IF-1 [Patescibacteria group bacterium]